MAKFRWRRVLAAIALGVLAFMLAAWAIHPIRVWLASGYYCKDQGRILYGKDVCGL